ncbi:hypothetical protein BDN70DRAFT_920130 [Pholiota conissans]|uniref:F-box domain-containing protein n=1 Tax=Pholiota conissans TaxID=109636 RepID=A0A9P5Z4K1_9AGAR|nr:hypothetical protein BDN70DRAFT_920130 [Pholiota conissans]
MSKPICIPPELFPVIASFLPSRDAPRTLLSLALGNRRFYSIVLPLLYSRLVLGDENKTISLLQRIVQEPELGLAVREVHLHVMPIGITARAMLFREKKLFTVISAFRDTLVNGKLVPRLKTLRIYLLDESYMISGQLAPPFWTALRTECPLLKTVVLSGMGNIWRCDVETQKGMGELLSIPGLSTLRLEPNPESLHYSGTRLALRKLPLLAESLHTLSLNAAFRDLRPLLSTNFVNLKCLRLDTFAFGNGDIDYSMTDKFTEFFVRHPQLESLTLANSTDSWLSDDIEEGFLPKLGHLKATFDDVLRLKIVLPQLISLSVTKNCNHQVPYLLRSAIPNGLPRLRSLEIGKALHEEITDSLDQSLLWYQETGNGHFRLQDNQNKKKSSAAFAHLRNLRRFYCVFHSVLAELFRVSETLVRLCPELESVTAIGVDQNIPYPAAVVERTFEGGIMSGVRCVTGDEGVGMQIPALDEDSFPSHLCSSDYW